MKRQGGEGGCMERRVEGGGGKVVREGREVRRGGTERGGREKGGRDGVERER